MIWWLNPLLELLYSSIKKQEFEPHITCSEEKPEINGAITNVMVFSSFVLFLFLIIYKAILFQLTILTLQRVHPSLIIDYIPLLHVSMWQAHWVYESRIVLWQHSPHSLADCTGDSTPHVRHAHAYEQGNIPLSYQSCHINLFHSNNARVIVMSSHFNVWSDCFKRCIMLIKLLAFMHWEITLQNGSVHVT